MKLSELLAKPFKLKGGATLNLKGFSKRVVDKEVDGSTNMFSNLFDSFIKNFSNEYLQDKVVNNKDTIIGIEEVTSGEYKLLYKKSFIKSLESNTNIIYKIQISDDIFEIWTILKNNLDIDMEFNIDEEIYCTIKERQG